MISNLSVRKSAGRTGWNLFVDLVTVTISASKEICCRNWEAVNLLADLVTVIKSVSQEIYSRNGGRVNLAVVLGASPNLPFRIYAGRFLGSVNLLTDLVTVTTSTSKGNLEVEML